MSLARRGLIVWMLGLAALPWLVNWQAPRPDGPPLSTLPQRAGPWQGTPGALASRQEMLAFGMENLYDDALLRRYRGPGGDFEVQIFYCRSRRPRNRLTNTTNLVNCLHGHYRRVGDEVLSLPPLRLRQLRLHRHDQHATVLFWLQSPGKTSPAGFEHLLWQYWQDLLLRRSDGCFVKIAYNGPPRTGQDKALRRLAHSLHQQVDAWLQKRSH